MPIPGVKKCGRLCELRSPQKILGAAGPQDKLQSDHYAGILAADADPFLDKLFDRNAGLRCTCFANVSRVDLKDAELYNIF